VTSDSQKPVATPANSPEFDSKEMPTETPVLVETTERITVLPLGKPGIEPEIEVTALRDVETVAVSFIFPFQHGVKHLSIDCAEAGWYSVDALILRIKFHLILLDPSGAVEGLMLRTKDGDHFISFERLESPMLSQKYPDLSWSGSARLAIDLKMNDLNIEIGENSLLVMVNQEWKDVVKVCRAS
jgi:hypothetical protein